MIRALELPETDGKLAQSSAGGMTGKMGTRPIIERTGNTSASERDLSVSLDQLGEVSHVLGEFEAA